MAYITNYDTKKVFIDDVDRWEQAGGIIGTSDEGGLNVDVANNLEEFKTAASNMSNEPIVDWKTSNKSFLKVHKQLKAKGIKNNTFFLTLFDQNLVGINPYNKILPEEIQLRILIECFRNPWYWLREICRIPMDGLPIEIGGGSQFKLDRNSLASWYVYINGLDQYDSKPRQCGKTQNAIAIENYSFHFGTISSTFTFGNKDATNNRMNLYRLKCQRDMLPAYMQMKMSIDDQGRMIKQRDNVTTLNNPINGNSIILLPAATSRDSANSNGRGMTSSNFYWDEFDFSRYNTTTLDSSSFAFGTAHKNALSNGCLTGRIITSTPGDLDNIHGATAKEFIDKMLVWEDSFFDLPIKKLHYEATRILPNNQSRNGFIYIEHTWRQLGKSNKWYETQCRLAQYDQIVILREIDLQRLHGSNRSPFSRADLTYLINHKKHPIKIDDMSKNLSPFRFYDIMNYNIEYVISIDPSDGLGQDNNAIVVINPYTQLAIAEFKSPYISQTDMVNMVIRFMDKYCPNAIIVPENNKGRTMIELFLASKYSDRVYLDQDKLGKIMETHKDEYGAEKLASVTRAAYGFNTNPSSRNVLMGTLEELVKEEKEKIFTEYIIDDICALVRGSTGKIQAMEGQHDDICMAWLIGMTIIRTSTCLINYGFERGRKEPQYQPDPNSEEYAQQKLLELMPRLPANLRALIQSSQTKSVEEDIRRNQEEIIRHKQMLDRQNYAQQEGIDYNTPYDEEYIGNNMMESILREQHERRHKSSFNINDFI